jgi:hypothetical protein
VVLAAQPVVPDPRRVRHAGVDLVHLPPPSSRLITAGTL